jgi:translation initiation factor IF-2
LSNPRVYEIAKELGVQNKDLIQRLASMGVDVKSHSSTVPAEIAEKLRSGGRGGQSRPSSGAPAPRPAAGNDPARSVAREGQPVRPAQPAQPAQPTPPERPRTLDDLGPGPTSTEVR